MSIYLVQLRVRSEFKGEWHTRRLVLVRAADPDAAIDRVVERAPKAGMDVERVLSVRRIGDYEVPHPPAQANQGDES